MQQVQGGCNLRFLRVHKRINMKTKIIIGIILLFVNYSFIKPETKFCEGWEEGYCEGWKDEKGQLAVCPVTPVCPIEPVDCNTYNCGYNKGFKAGKKKAKE